MGYHSADAHSNLCGQRSPLQFTEEEAEEQRGHGQVSLFLRARLGWEPRWPGCRLRFLTALRKSRFSSMSLYSMSFALSWGKTDSR